MSRQKKPPSNSESISAPSSGGKKRGRSKRSKLLPVREDTMSSPIQLSLDLFGLQLSTQECLVAPNNQTSIVKLPPLPTSTPMPKSSAKLAEDSTSSAKSFLPYWNESCKELSDVLLSPIKTGLLGSVLTCLDGFANSMGAKSWFSMKQVSLQKQKWLKTSLPSSTVSVPDSTACENTSLRCRKIQIYPNAELKAKWKHWSAACRYVYN